MLFNDDRRVFVGKRIDQTVEGWQMPQGGIDPGETPRQAVLRELLEEVGTDKADIVAEMEQWLTYDLPPHLRGVAFHGRYRGQKQKWFALHFTGIMTTQGIGPVVAGALAEVTSTSVAIALMGVGAVLVALTWWRLTRP